MPITPTLQFEHTFWWRGLARVAGVDEAGRGAWAGPVVAGAVILPRVHRIKAWWLNDALRALEHARDSKLLSPAQRDALYEPIRAHALAAATGLATNDEIDALGIVPATRLAMQRALDALTITPDALLIDAVKLREVHLPQKAIIRGDQLSLSIACASILAKVTRDRMMIELDAQLPGYGFARHKGYGTAAHQAALAKLGASRAHRVSFAPVKQQVDKETGKQVAPVYLFPCLPATQIAAGSRKNRNAVKIIILKSNQSDQCST
ncbi:MAG: ribonuclease HII [Anaerolineales bacterium]|nr:ribonuclease HII [Anaerolineales bacterium]